MTTGMKYFNTLLILMFIGFGALAQDPNLKLWYDKPAGQVWEAALPIGNGRLAAMVYGNPGKESIKLNEATVWSGGPSRNDNPELLPNLPRIRELIFEDKNIEAGKLLEQSIKRPKSQGMMFQPVGDLNLSFTGHENYTN